MSVVSRSYFLLALCVWPWCLLSLFLHFQRSQPLNFNLGCTNQKKETPHSSHFIGSVFFFYKTLSKLLWKCWSNNIALSRIIKIKATTESPFLLILFSTSKLMSPYFDLLNVLLPAQILSYWCSFWKHGWDIDWLGTGKMIMHNYSIKEMLYVDWSGTLNIPKNKRWNKPMVTWRKHCISALHF